ncbi:MAG: excalibur calcium-binding domain-containing protein [Parasphingopyxis sp.]
MSITIIVAAMMLHPGGLAADGCHYNRRTGVRHCHRAQSSSSSSGPARGGRLSNGAFVNCTAARNAGAAPVYRGDRGYGSHLDRDNDGIGCE